MLKSPKGSMSISSWITMPPTRRRRSRRGLPVGRNIMSTSRRLRHHGSTRSSAGLPSSPESGSVGVFIPLSATRNRFRAFIDRHNQNPRPFKWTKSADQILASVNASATKRSRHYAANFRFNMTRPFAHKESVFDLVSPAPPSCDPHPAFSTAISVQFTIAGASGNSARCLARLQDRLVPGSRSVTSMCPIAG